MTRPRFNIDLYRGAWTSYVVCSGDLDAGSTAELRVVVDRSLERPCRTVIFNGAAITLLTPDAADVLVALASRCRAEAVNLEVILNARSRRLVRLLGVAAPSQDPAGSRPDYAIPREVADALLDVMDEGDLGDAFFADELAGVLRGCEDVTLP